MPSLLLLFNTGRRETVIIRLYMLYCKAIVVPFEINSWNHTFIKLMKPKVRKDEEIFMEMAVFEWCQYSLTKRKQNGIAGRGLLHVMFRVIIKKAVWFETFGHR